MDFEPAIIKAVAENLLSQPNERLSKPNELRYGSNGSLSIDLEKNTYFDHEKNEGGGLLDLVQRETKTRGKKAAMQWLQTNGFATSEATAPIKAKVVAVYDYKGGTGELLFQVQRFEPKKFIQRRPDGNGWKYSVKGVRQVPYRLPELLTGPPHKTVYIVEGEKDADRLASLGLVATCNAGGAGKWRAEHSKHLEGRTVFVIPDNDDAGRDHANKVAKSLQGIAAHVRILELPDIPEKGDVSDWLDAGGTAEKLVALPSKAAEVSSDTDEEDEGRKPSQTDMLVTFAREKFDLLHDSNGDVFAKDKTTAEVRRLGGRSFKDRLIAGFYQKTEIAVRDQALREALGTLQALGRFNGEAQAVHIRVAKHKDSYFLDLCEPGNSRAVELCAGSWRIVDAPPVMFVRGDAMQPLPTPVHGGQLAPLWQVANVPPALRQFVIAWLIDAMRPETPYPGLELVGEQGSGKSTAAEAFRRVIDPNACNLRGAPKTVEDIFVAAGQSHIVAYENVSHLAGTMQDALAILSTGGGFSKRQLYSDAEEHIISVRRPWLLNGISVSVTQQDLVDRVISIECPVIATRQASSQQWVDFSNALPGILGGLMDIAAKALAALPTMRLAPTDRPRLMEYVLLGMATAQAMGGKPEDFLTGFRELRADTVARTLDASPVAAAVLDFVDDNPAGATTTVKDLLNRLEKYKPPGAEAWPRSPKGLGDAMRRAAPALRQLDVDCRCLGKGSGGVVRWVVQKKVLESKSQKSQVPNLSEFVDSENLGLGTFGTLEPEVSLASGVSL